MSRPCPQCGDFYVREKGVCPRCRRGDEAQDQSPLIWGVGDRAYGVSDLAADSFYERREERLQREADRADFARHE